MATSSGRYLRYILFAFFVSAQYQGGSAEGSRLTGKGHTHTLLHLYILIAVIHPIPNRGSGQTLLGRHKGPTDATTSCEANF